ncbi:D-glycerate dehydrogenase [Desulfobacterota bacterium AH_259_B03_O07]|nr:D-glycerate dehydrogenase [Desulfobacterota bacterium AH_259_B03_O07]
MKKIFVTSKLPGNAVDSLKKDFDVEIFDKHELPTKIEVQEGAKDAIAILSTVSNQIDKDIIDTCPNLIIISNFGVGFENIDVPYATEKRIYVTNTPGVLTETTADLAWALMFGVARRVVEGDSVVRKGQFKRWDPSFLLGMDVFGKTLGIYGLGRIGSAVGRRARGFNMRVIYVNKSRRLEAEEEIGCDFVDFPTLLGESDFLVITAPLTESTRGRFGLDEFKKMKRNSILINIARGPIVREKELVQALKKKVIWGAGLDVYENEPEVEKDLLGLDNVVLLPHLGSASFETRERMTEMAVENAKLALNGKVPVNLVNREVLKHRN